MPLPLFTGTLGQKRAAHLLRRATFISTKQQIDSFASLTAANAINVLFNNTLPDPVLPIDPEIGMEWITTATDEDENERIGFFKKWLIGQIIGNNIDLTIKASYSCREKITFFLHTFFTTQAEKVRNSRALYYQNALFRFYAFDSFDNPVDPLIDLNFKELVKKVSIDNAMLIFLDGRQNVKENPNENYSREMFELYTIGRGLEGTLPDNLPDGDYEFFTEQDVQAAARVLTGFKSDNGFSTLDEETGLPRGRADYGSHTIDSTEKEFTDKFTGTEETITPDPALLTDPLNTDALMLDELSQMIEMIYTNREASKHLCRKLYRFYVYYDITEELDNTIIESMVDTFIANGYKMQPVIEELLQSQHFYDAAVGLDDDKFGGIIKSPLDIIVGTLGFLNLPIPNYETETEDFYEFAADILDRMGKMGLNFYQPFEVAGYSAYHQFPIFNRNWISTNYLAQRYNFIRQLPLDSDDNPTYNLLGFFQDSFTDLGNAKSVVVQLASYIFSQADNLDFDSTSDNSGLTSQRLRYFLQAFLGFTNYEMEADNAVSDWAVLYSNPANYLEVGDQLKRLTNAMLQSPEYQLY